MSPDSVTLQSGWYHHDEKAPWGNLRIPESVKLVPGWFNETVRGFLDDHGGEKISLVHIDSNLYSSAKTVLGALAGRIGAL